MRLPRRAKRSSRPPTRFRSRRYTLASAAITITIAIGGIITITITIASLSCVVTTIITTTITIERDLSHDGAAHAAGGAWVAALFEARRDHTGEATPRRPL